MSHFSGGQLNQLGDKLEAAGWSADDVTNLGQASVERLTEIRFSLSKSDIIAAIEVGKTELWRHDDQKTGWVRGRVILKHLTDEGLLGSCADLDELKVIQAKGPEFFRRHKFAGKAIVGWRGVRDGEVPYLVEGGDGVVLGWGRLDFSFGALIPGLRRK